MKCLLVVVFVASAGVVLAGPATPDALKTELEALRPAKHAWRAIDWQTCPLAALKAARQEKKPIVAWVFLGIPTDERC
jgi:hypothetical protein